MQTIEDILQADGFYMTAARGDSMRPFIRPGVDTVVLEKPGGECAPMDVVLYRGANAQLVLHRVLKVQARQYLICGDNCISFEYVEKGNVLARLRGLYRGEKEIKLDSRLCRLYVCLWCRPYRVRMSILKARRRLRQMAGKLLRRLRKR